VGRTDGEPARWRSFRLAEASQHHAHQQSASRRILSISAATGAIARVFCQV
jgi:hypothetical protein